MPPFDFSLAAEIARQRKEEDEKRAQEQKSGELMVLELRIAEEENQQERTKLLEQKEAVQNQDFTAPYRNDPMLEAVEVIAMANMLKRDKNKELGIWVRDIDNTQQQEPTAFAKELPENLNAMKERVLTSQQASFLLVGENKHFVLFAIVPDGEEKVKVLYANPTITPTDDNPAQAQHAAVGKQLFQQIQEQLQVTPEDISVDRQYGNSCGPAAAEAIAKIAEHYEQGIKGLPKFTPRPASDPNTKAYYADLNNQYNEFIRMGELSDTAGMLGGEVSFLTPSDNLNSSFVPPDLSRQLSTDSWVKVSLPPSPLPTYNDFVLVSADAATNLTDNSALEQINNLIRSEMLDGAYGKPISSVVSEIIALATKGGISQMELIELLNKLEDEYLAELRAHSIAAFSAQGELKKDNLPEEALADKLDALEDKLNEKYSSPIKRRDLELNKIIEDAKKSGDIIIASEQIEGLMAKKGHSLPEESLCIALESLVIIAQQQEQEKIAAQPMKEAYKDQDIVTLNDIIEEALDQKISPTDALDKLTKIADDPTKQNNLEGLKNAVEILENISDGVAKSHAEQLRIKIEREQPRLTTSPRASVERERGRSRGGVEI